MRQSTPGPRCLPIVVATADTVATSSAGWAAPTGSAVLEGRVFDADGSTPRPGVVVVLAESPDGATWESAPSSSDGAFVVDDAPTGEYTVLVRDGDAVYLAGRQVPIRDGMKQEVLLSVQPNLAPASTGNDELPRWGEWMIFGAIALSGAYLANEIFTTDDSESPASPF